MYQLVSALCKSKKIGGRWISVDIGELRLTDLFQLYTQVYARLKNPLYSSDQSFDLNNLRSRLEGSSQTFNSYLNSLGDAQIQTSAIQYGVSTQLISYSDAFRAHYKIDPISPLGHIDSSILANDRQWLSITRANTDLNYFFDNCLVSVNGFIHQTDCDGNRIYVIDGMRSCRLSGQNTVGILNFSSLGKLKRVNIEESMIHRRYMDFSYAKKMYIDLEASYTGTPILVLGGYLHVLDASVFTRVSEKIFVINFSKIPLRERYFESRHQIDLSSLGLDHDPQSPERIENAQLWSDSVLTKYATLSQSFIVFCENDSLFVEREDLPATRLPNTYISYTEPRYPLVCDYGRLREYWRVFEDGQWVVKVQDNVEERFEFNTAFESDLICIDEAKTPGEPLAYSRAHYLVIGSDHLFTLTA